MKDRFGHGERISQGMGNKIDRDYKNGTDLYHMVKQHYLETGDYLSPDVMNGQIINFLKERYGSY